MSQSKLLVLSLTRMGDIIQSIPFFRRLRLRNPEAQIHVLVEECFADVASLLPDVDIIHRVRLEDLLPSLAAPQSDLTRATAFYRHWVAGLQAEQFTQVWNLTHTKPSVVLSYLLAGGKGMGVTLDQAGLQRVNSPWLMYFYATNLARPWCQFNLVDIYANCVEGIDWSAGRTVAIKTDLLPQPNPLLPEKPGVLRIAIHAAASQKGKQWPVASYYRLASQLLRHPQVEIVLVGGRADQNLAAEFSELPRTQDYLGKTTVPELAALLRQCRILISNDSGPMHVAAAVGTPVIAVTVGSALGSETAPYGEGHLVVEPDSECFPCSPHEQCTHQVCAGRISVEALLSLTEWAIGLRRHLPPDDLGSSRIYRTRFSRTDGLLELERLFSTKAAPRDELNSAARLAWLSVLPHDIPGYRSPASAEVGESHTGILSAAAECRIIQQAAVLLAEQAEHAPSRLDALQRQALQLLGLEQALERRLLQSGLPASFQMYVNIARASLQGQTVADQARETVRIYQRLQQMLQIMDGPIAKNEQSIDNSAASRKERHEDLA